MQPVQFERIVLAFLLLLIIIHLINIFMEQTILNPNDKLEIVTFVGGG